MARRLRIQYPGAVYHVINRGNYRTDVFDSAGAAKAFEQVLEDTCGQFQWKLYAYVIMRNHFHLAIETPQPNLVEGMHWLQSTYATRFNRMRSERGHLFQGRYQALLIEDDAALARVVDYVHLNPVRAKIVLPEQIANFRWSSLARFGRTDRPAHLTAAGWLTQLGFDESASGWRSYGAHLVARATGDAAASDGDEFCRGWAIGTAGWRKAIAEEHAEFAISPGYAAAEIRELRHALWSGVLDQVLKGIGRSAADAHSAAKGAEWKCVAAARVRNQSGAAYSWIAEKLRMGGAGSVRSLLSRRRLEAGIQQFSA